MDTDILFEDNHVIAVNKPAGLLTQGALKVHAWRSCNLNAFLKRAIRISSRPSGNRKKTSDFLEPHGHENGFLNYMQQVIVVFSDKGVGFSEPGNRCSPVLLRAAKAVPTYSVRFRSDTNKPDSSPDLHYPSRDIFIRPAKMISSSCLSADCRLSILSF